MNPFICKTALITGASAGIGRAMALSLAPKNLTLILVARRPESLQELKQQILKQYPDRIIHLIDSDVNAPDLPARIAKISNERIDILINNAGIAIGKDKIEHSNFSDWELMMSTNVTANFRMAHLVVPWMLKHGGGDIINLCSIAGFLTYPGGAVYCATKHAVHAFTRVLREETAGRNIRVMQISPGMVNTEFSTARFDGDKALADKVYHGMVPLVGEDIARMMQFMLDQPRHVVIDEIITMPIAQGSPTTVVRSHV
ncbi:MAG: SDR family NAD(P)-dependent oxidoreductase [Bdellovibrionales bacterium]|nr:SDR family NAD(P)-dependent oxidoreductase [Bdellovibrionales bacterium]